MEALVAIEDGRLVGMIHMVFHPVTDDVGPACFLNDLFVADDRRRRGIGRRLIEALYEEARAGARRGSTGICKWTTSAPGGSMTAWRRSPAIRSIARRCEKPGPSE
jgi:GNAT superfamily N-acetyltransferase